MKSKGIKFFSVGLMVLALLFTACRDKNGDYDASGVFEATEVVVSAQGTGEIVELNIQEGQTVEAGALLGYIDTVQLALKREQLLANKISAESRQYDVSKQIASLQQQIATQKSERVRYRKLVRSNAANQKQLDDVEALLARLEKELAAQTESLEKNNQGALGELLGLSAQIDQLNDQIVKNGIVSPIDGTILSKYAEMGELATQGRPLFKVADIVHLFLRAYVTADQLTEIKIGQTVRVFADEGTSGRREYAGVVSWISDKAEFTPKTIQTRNERANLVYAVKIAVENDGYIKRGMYGEMKIGQ
ncbi:MAG: HlyD family efflux transporter periplasmic adaptor subunit [Porphyromonadaceae bacterium]|nr:HlyD family efflux transporter periplasmic adaptor subunit [Porphyromonadaceae bacterium]